MGKEAGEGQVVGEGTPLLQSGGGKEGTVWGRTAEEVSSSYLGGIPAGMYLPSGSLSDCYATEPFGSLGGCEPHLRVTFSNA